MEPIKLQYVIEIIRQGDGASRAAEDLESLATAADKSADALEQQNAKGGQAGKTQGELKDSTAATMQAMGITLGIEHLTQKYIEAARAAENLQGAQRAVGQGKLESEHLLDESKDGPFGAQTDAVARRFDVRKQNVEAYYSLELNRAGENATEIERIEQEKTLVLKQLDEDRTLQVNQTLGSVGLSFRGISQEISTQGTSMFMAMANGSEAALPAIRKFFASIMDYFAQAIMQALIFRAVSSLFGAFSGTGAVGNVSGGGSFSNYTQGTALGYAEGGIHFAAAGALSLAGVSTTDGLTYLPKHNVIAGELGPEALAVLANPQATQVGRIQAMIGNVNGNTLAIVNAGDLMQLANVPGPTLAAAGFLSNPTFYPQFPARPEGVGSSATTGGYIDINIHLEPGLTADIVNSSVEAANIRVLNDLNQSGPIATSVKNLSGR